jgi:transposase
MRFVPAKSRGAAVAPCWCTARGRASWLQRTADHQPHPRAAQRVRRGAAPEGGSREARSAQWPGWRTCPAMPTLVIGDLLSEVAHLDERIAQYDQHIATRWPGPSARRRSQLMQLPGVGETTTATATAWATVGHAREFDSVAASYRRLAGPGAGAVQLGRQGSGWDASPRRATPTCESAAGAGRSGRCSTPRRKARPTRLSRWAISTAHSGAATGSAVVAIAAKNARLCLGGAQPRARQFRLPA